jgi:hypothetical protein
MGIGIGIGIGRRPEAPRSHNTDSLDLRADPEPLISMLFLI